MLLPSGPDEKWSADSMESFTYLRNIQDLLSDGKTPYERWFGMPYNGPIDDMCDELALRISGCSESTGRLVADAELEKLGG